MLERLDHGLDGHLDFGLRLRFGLRFGLFWLRILPLCCGVFFLVVVAAMMTTTSAGIGIKLSSFGVPDEAIALISNKRVRSEHL